MAFDFFSQLQNVGKVRIKELMDSWKNQQKSYL